MFNDTPAPKTDRLLGEQPSVCMHVRVFVCDRNVVGVSIFCDDFIRLGFSDDGDDDDDDLGDD